MQQHSKVPERGWPPACSGIRPMFTLSKRGLGATYESPSLLRCAVAFRTAPSQTEFADEISLDISAQREFWCHLRSEDAEVSRCESEAAAQVACSAAPGAFGQWTQKHD